MKKSRLAFLGVLISASILSCATPKLAIPEIEYKSTSEIERSQPDCTPPIMAALNDPGRETMIDAFYCYDTVIQYYLDEYEVLESQLETLQRSMGE